MAHLYQDNIAETRSKFGYSYNSDSPLNRKENFEMTRRSRERCQSGSSRQTTSNEIKYTQNIPVISYNQPEQARNVVTPDPTIYQSPPLRAYCTNDSHFVPSSRNKDELAIRQEEFIMRCMMLERKVDFKDLLHGYDDQTLESLDRYIESIKNDSRSRSPRSRSPDSWSDWKMRKRRSRSRTPNLYRDSVSPPRGIGKSSKRAGQRAESRTNYNHSDWI